MQHQEPGCSLLGADYAVSLKCPCIQQQDLVDEDVEAVKLPAFELRCFVLVLEAAELRVVAEISRERSGAVAKPMGTSKYSPEIWTARKHSVDKRLENSMVGQRS